MLLGPGTSAGCPNSDIAGKPNIKTSAQFRVLFYMRTHFCQLVYLQVATQLAVPKVNMLQKDTELV